MRTFHIPARAAAVLAIVMLAHSSPAGANNDASFLDDDQGAIVTFTKWITITPGFPIMEGFTGGEAAGSFSGEIFVAQTTIDQLITRLEAVYEIHAGNHSFTALIRGGQNNKAGTALLDGVVLDGWLTGEAVHVQYRVIHCDQPNAAGGTCFQGTIRIGSEFEH
jgi:hypothetical protein